MIRHHRLIEAYLAEALGMPEDRVHEEAEVLEHYISEELERLIADKLGDPRHDPHGDPIPTPEPRPRGGPHGRARQSFGWARSRPSPASPTRTRACCATWPTAGSAPGRLRVIASQPFGGPLFVEVDGEEHALGGGAGGEDAGGAGG